MKLVRSFGVKKSDATCTNFFPSFSCARYLSCFGLQGVNLPNQTKLNTILALVRGNKIFNTSTLVLLLKKSFYPSVMIYNDNNLSLLLLLLLLLTWLVRVGKKVKKKRIYIVYAPSVIQYFISCFIF